MSQLALFIDAPTLSEATAVYTDSALTVLAVDGYYSDQNITRQQLSGALGASITCPDCSGSTPAAPTVYNVIQNVTNNIVGTLNVDYTLSGTGYDGGDPAGPVTQTGQVNEQYQFNILPSVVQGKQFSSASPFSATNPKGSIPVGGTTVTNTLTGTIEIIPTGAGTLNYVLTACQGNNGESPSSGLISRTLANKPTPNQRFAAVNVEPTQYYYYDPAITAKSNPSQADFLEQRGGTGLVLSKIEGETGCPTFNVKTGLIVQLRKCLDGSTDYYMQLPNAGSQWRDGTRVTPDNGSTFYTQQGVLQNSQLSGKTEFINVNYPDATGIFEGQPGFQSRVVGCPGDTYFELRECNPLTLTLIGGRRGVSSLPANDRLFAAGSLQNALNQSGSVYRDNQGSCWQIQDSLTGAQVSTYYSSSSSSINLEAYVGNDCQACSGYV